MTRVSDVNTTDILDAIRLGSRTMCGCFNADDGDVPYFRAIVRPDAFLGISMESHVPGRHLNALLNAEDAAGVAIDEGCIDKHAGAAFLSYSGPVPLPLGRVDMKGRPVHFSPHDVREGFHALYALAKYRDSDRARELAEASISTIFEYWDPDHGWDYERLEGQHGLTFQKPATFISGLARSIGPLVKYYRATGHGPALELAIVLKEKAVREFFAKDGSYDGERFGTHAHSVTCVLSSLAQLANLTGDSPLMDRVRAFYDNGLWEMRDELGWSIESTRKDSGSPDEGEMNNTGDILETALILGRWGYTEYYHDAERILRCHLLPSQLRDVSFIEEPRNPDGVDGRRNVAERIRGAFGFPAPFGHEPLENERIRFNLDVVGGAVGSLCEAYREIARSDDAGLWVCLLFDHETPEVKVESPYTGPALRITPKRQGPLFVRIPPWVAPQDLDVQGVQGTPRHTNGYLFIPEPEVNRTITVGYPLRMQEITLRHRTRQIRTRLRGDEVSAMDSFGADLTFFDALE
jgi:hypothetical protein